MTLITERARRKSDAGRLKPERVASALEREIRAGKLGFGSRLQSEKELGKRFAVSRATVRKSLESLAEKGLIRTRMGIGSFVTFDGEALDSELGWTRALAMRRGDVETRVLRCEIVEDAELARQFGQDSPRFLALDRLRVLKDEGRAISIERSRVPLLAELEGLEPAALADGSLQATLRRAGLVADHGDECAAVEFVNAEDAAILGAAPGAAALRTTRTVRDRRGRVLEHVVSLLDPKHFALRLEF